MHEKRVGVQNAICLKSGDLCFLAFGVNFYPNLELKPQPY